MAGRTRRKSTGPAEQPAVDASDAALASPGQDGATPALDALQTTVTEPREAAPGLDGSSGQGSATFRPVEPAAPTATSTAVMWTKMPDGATPAVAAVDHHDEAVIWTPPEPTRRTFNPARRRAPASPGHARRPVAAAEHARRQRLAFDWQMYQQYRPLIELPVRLIGALLAWRFAAEWLATPHPADPGPIDTTYVDPITSRFLLMALGGAGLIGFILAPFPTTRLLAWLIRSGQALAPWRFAAGLAGVLFGLVIAALVRPALPDIPVNPEAPDAITVWKLLPLAVTLGSAALFGFVASSYPEDARGLTRRLIAQTRRSLRTVTTPDGSVIDYSALGDGRVLSLAQAGLLGKQLVVLRLVDDVIARDLHGSESLAQQAASAQWTLGALQQAPGVRVIRPVQDGALHDATVALASARRLRVVTASDSVAALAQERGCPVINLADLDSSPALGTAPSARAEAALPAASIVDEQLPVALLSQDDAPVPGETSQPGRGKGRRKSAKMMPEPQG